MEPHPGPAKKTQRHRAGLRQAAQVGISPWRENTGGRKGESANSGPSVTYALLSRLGFPKSYQGKILFVIFVGTHVPLIALVLYVLLCSPVSLRPALGGLALLLVTILAGTAATLYALKGLLAPVQLASSSLKEYLDSRKVPDLPERFTDEAGRLMANVHYTVERLDTTIRFLEGLSGTDHLTGVLNRRQGEKRLAEEAARVRRGEEVLTLGIVDINKFKHINDTYGHQAGDACIQHVADVIRRNIRQGDWLVRWGGDEFVLALRDATPFAQTGALLQRIVRELKASPVRLPQGEELTLSVTVGASRYSGEEDLRDLLARADEAMYEAKREGRPWILST
jgi:diguanylate cyclase (GGDEF)-like protein